MIIVQQDDELYKHEDGEGWVADADRVLSITKGDGEMIAMYSRWDWVKVSSEPKATNAIHFEGTIDSAAVKARIERDVRNKVVWQ